MKCPYCNNEIYIGVLPNYYQPPFIFRHSREGHVYTKLDSLEQQGYILNAIEGIAHGQGGGCCNRCICVYAADKTFWCRSNLLCGCHGHDELENCCKEK